MSEAYTVQQPYTQLYHTYCTPIPNLMPFHDAFVCELFNKTMDTSQQSVNKNQYANYMIDLTISCDILRMYSILISREGENKDITHDRETMKSVDM